MKPTVRRLLAFGLTWLGLSWLGLSCAPAHAQAPSPINSKIEYSYIAPKSLKYVATADRLRQFQFLEQLSQFLSPLRLPHNFSMVALECGFVNAQYVPSRRRIELCYEFVEAIERVGPKQGEPTDFSYEEVVVGSLVGVILHELGHAVFDMNEVPVLGREEDAADAISTFIALQFNKDVARTIVRGNAYLYKVWFAFGAPLYSDEHGTGLQRYYNSLCLAYGADPELFKDLLDKGDLPKTRAANCSREYQQIKSAFEKTVLPYVDQEQMKKVQGRPWLKFSPQQAALLKQQQQQQSKLFTLAVCNHSTITNVSVALLVRQAQDPQKWHALGWFSIPNNGCNLIGSFYGDRAYYYAEGNGGKAAWHASDKDPTAAKQCIDPVNAFDLVAASRCQTGQAAANFIRRDVDPSSSGITWHLRGGK